jgi:acyl-CoA synthetase (AMP-forming)/AMP-acid ligase II
VFRDLIAETVAAGGKRTAVIDDLGAVTYRALDAWSGLLARDLAPACGNDARARVAMMLLPNSAAWFAAYLGTLRSGMQCAPLNWQSTDAEVMRAIEQTLPAVVLAAPERADAVQALCARLGTASRVQVLTVPLDHPQGLADEADSVPPTGLERSAGPQDTCLLIHTSGTTGTCRAMVQTEQALHLTIGQWRTRFRTDVDVVAVPIPSSHSYGHLIAASTLLAQGTILVSAQRFDPHRWLAAIAGHRATVLEGVPAMFARLLEALSDPGAADAGLELELKLCLSAGQQASRSLRERWHTAVGVPLRQSWGMTELAGAGLAPLEHSCPDSVGVPVPGLEVRIVDPATGEPVPRGATGELRVRGAQVSPGQQVGSWQRARIANEQGWLHTRDLAACDEHGCHRIVGRSKDAIMTNGYTVQPAEVEEALRTHPYVCDAVVVGRADERRGEAVHAVVVLQPDSPLESEHLLEHCRGLLARYKVPRTVEFVARLPLNATGKVDRAALTGAANGTRV